MSAPQVYKAINAVAADLAGAAIPKRHRNERDDYLYRSVDDVLDRLSPLLARHKLCVLPRVLERTSADRIGEGDQLLVGVVLRVAFDLVSCVDGSSHTITAYGEALDASDKATAKAMSSAFKQAMLQAFCVPVTQVDDADRSSHRLKRGRTHPREPVEGWEQWAAGVIDIAESCASPEALRRLQERQRSLLTAISRERADLYATIGAAFSRQTDKLGEGCARSARIKAGAKRAKIETEPNGEECARSAIRKAGAKCTNVNAAPDGEQCAISTRKGEKRARTRERKRRGARESLQSLPATDKGAAAHGDAELTEPA